MTKPTWTPIKIKLGDIVCWEHNPRMSNKAQAKRLIESEKHWGQPMTFAVSPFDESGKVQLYDGHQRYAAWVTVYGADYQVDARQCDYFLTEEERLEFVVTMHAGATGSWDWQKLSSFPAPKLIEMGFDGDLKKQYDFDANNIKELLNSEGIGELDNNYSRKIEAPIYTPKGDKPAITDLYDQKRAQELTAEIDAADLPEDEKEFLRIAARRHTVLNFKRIAEYYAHSPAPVQRLMENSALVIIDFKRAIELGYVKLSEEIAAQYLKDYPDAG